MRVLMTITRFRGDLKEAISKNIVLLTEEISRQTNWEISTYTPVDFQTKADFNKIVFSEKQHYDSWKDNLYNIYKVAKYINDCRDEYEVFNIHIGPLYELFCLQAILNKDVVSKVVITIWQPYLTTEEILDKKTYYLKNAFENKHQFVLNSKFLYSAYKGGLKVFKHIIVQSRYQKKQIMQMTNGDKVQIIPNGLLPVRVNKKKKLSSRRKKLLYIGHMKTSKGCDIMITLLSLISRKCDVKLTIATSGRGNHVQIQKLINKHNVGQFIEWKGKVNVYEEIQSADAFIVLYQSSVGTSYYPNVILESIAVGTPIITTNIGAISEVVKHRQTGLIIDPNNLSASLEDIVELLTNDMLREQMSMNQQKFFEETFLLDKVANKYIGKFSTFKRV